jgi:hypothetical protein
MATDGRSPAAGRLLLIVLGVAAVGVAAFLLYSSWDAPRLDGSRIDRFSYGPQGVNIREFAVLPRAQDPELIDRVLELVNQAPLTSRPVEPKDGRVVLVLFREDGLQFDLLQGAGDVVGLAEGDRGYLGALQSPELAALLADLARAGRSG